MRFVLILTAAFAICAQAAPQFNNFGLRGWRSSQNENRNNGIINLGFPSPSTFIRHRRPNNYNDQETRQNDRESVGQCWDPVEQTYKDQPNQTPPTRTPRQFNDDDYRPENDYYHPMNSYYNHDDRYHGSQSYPGPSQHHHGHRPPPPPPHHHHHQHGPPPPPPQSHHHYHQHGPPPPSSHHHHHQHGPPPPPPHHHRPNRPAELPPRRPHRPISQVNDEDIEICRDTATQNTVLSDYMETSTTGDKDVVNIPSSSPAPISSVAPVDSRNEDLVTQATIDSSVKVTTEFDWNNYYAEVSADNTGGIGAIDVRGGGLTPPPV